jgi:hypothetical protein
MSDILHSMFDIRCSAFISLNCMRIQSDIPMCHNTIKMNAERRISNAERRMPNGKIDKSASRPRELS